MDLTRDRVDSARSPIKRAFSCEWVTHVLADRAIHPLIGLGVGEASFGDRTRFVSGARDPETHVRIETGVDLAYRTALGACGEGGHGERPPCGRSRPGRGPGQIRCGRITSDPTCDQLGLHGVLDMLEGLRVLLEAGVAQGQGVHVASTSDLTWERLGRDPTRTFPSSDNFRAIPDPEDPGADPPV